MITKSKVLDSLKHLPPFPDNFIKILNLIKSGNATGLKLGTLISNDTYLSSEILKYCNSATFPFTSSIKSISHAVMLLGFEKISSISSMLFLRKQFEIKEDTPFFDIFKHSIGIAHGAEYLYGKLTKSRDYYAFTSGLLTDVGKNAFLKTLINSYPQFIDEYVENCIKNVSPLDSIEYENEMFGFNHAEIGFLLSESWNLPNEITNTIKNHHNLINAKKNHFIKAILITDMIISNNKEIDNDFLNYISEDFNLPISYLEETISTSKIATEMVIEN